MEWDRPGVMAATIGASRSADSGRVEKVVQGVRCQLGANAGDQLAHAADGHVVLAGQVVLVVAKELAPNFQLMAHQLAAGLWGKEMVCPPQCFALSRRQRDSAEQTQVTDT